ncbi:MAG: hypothetical protein QMC36_06725 [Patescibacteria group bacterium]
MKLNAEKFKISAFGKTFPFADAALPYDPKGVTIGAVDYVSSTTGGKKRVSSYHQVGVASSATRATVVTGNYPTTLS